jgi:bifunctional non-homologous end joining protein LigD
VVLLNKPSKYLSVSLKRYREKRDFEETDEPRGVVRALGGKGSIYVVQKHDARRLHYDLRLERDGVLKSWAVPKQPPTQKGVKRLAVQVEDHPVEYASFEGAIPEGEYGAGTVEIWDNGTYAPEKWREDEIIVHINGTRLSGRYCLIKFRKQENGWLFFKC